MNHPHFLKVDVRRANNTKENRDWVGGGGESVGGKKARPSKGGSHPIIDTEEIPRKAEVKIVSVVRLLKKP